MPRNDIGWVRQDADGTKLAIYAHQIGTRWHFYCRAGRGGDWSELAEPLLEDWLECLDGVRRRSARQQYGPEQAGLLEAHIRKLFPRAVF
jgi:hypothetical protein